MTVYELAKSIDSDKRERLARAGILSRSIDRYIYIYELFLERSKTESTMQAYAYVSEKCYTCEDNVRKIIRKMGETIP